MTTDDPSDGRVVYARMGFFAVFVLVHMAIASQIYWLSRDILVGDGSCRQLRVSPRYPPLRIEGTMLASKFSAEGRLCADFAQIYFPSQKRNALGDAYSRSTTLDPWKRPSKYPPLLHFIYAQTFCRLNYGPACFAHLLLQIGLFLASFAYAFYRLGLRKYLFPSLLLVNICLFLSPVGLSWLERGQFSLYVALCYLWLMLSVIKGDKRYAVIAALFGFVKWTSFPFIFVVLSIYLIMSENFREFRERLLLSALCGGTIMLLFLASPGDAIFFLKGLFVQELGHAVPSGISLQKLLPRFAVKAVPFFLVGVGIVKRLNFRRDASYLMPFFAGSATILITCTLYAFDYSLPCLTPFVPFVIHWAKLPGVDRSIGVIVQSLFFLFLILASYAHSIFHHSESVVIMSYVVMAVILVGTTFFVRYQAPGGEPAAIG